MDAEARTSFMGNSHVTVHSEAPELFLLLRDSDSHQAHTNIFNGSWRVYRLDKSCICTQSRTASLIL